ncbi:hypothetical protein ScPMuIL_015785 [Solemya velum]
MVYCKVISMEEDGEKISLSMKAVNQTTGQDLDPNNVQQSLDDRKKKKGHRSDIPKIELGLFTIPLVKNVEAMVT